MTTSSPVTSITDELLTELEQLAVKATPGPWNYDGSYVCTQKQEGETTYVESWNPVADALLSKNVHYIARANPATILALLQHVRELRVNADRWKAVEHACGAVTLRLHNSRPGSRQTIIDAARSSTS